MAIGLSITLDQRDIDTLDRWIESADKDGIPFTRSSIIRSLIRQQARREAENFAEDQAYRRNVAGL